MNGVASPVIDDASRNLIPSISSAVSWFRKPRVLIEAVRPNPLYDFEKVDYIFEEFPPSLRVPDRSSRVVQPGETFDGGCKTFNPSFGDGGQGEGQPPVFRVEKGGVLKNVIIGNNGADGVHIHGDATVDNVTWTDVGEDALTVKAAARVTLRNLTGASAEDKFFQLNAPTTFNVENIVVNGASKLFRENGGKCYPVHVTVNRAKLTNFKEAVFRSDCNKSTFALSNAELVNVKQVCYAGGKYASCGLK